MTIDDLMAQASQEHYRRECAISFARSQIADPFVSRQEAAEIYQAAHALRWPAMVQSVYGRDEVVETYRRLLRAAMEGKVRSGHGIASAIGIDSRAYARNGWARVYGWAISVLEGTGKELAA